LARLYDIKVDFTKAYQLKDEATAMKDSVFNAENSKILANAQANAEKERAEKEKERRAKEQEIKDARQRLFNYLGIGVTIFIAGVAFLLYRGQQREKKHSQEIALEKDKSDKLLLNILPEEVAEELKTEGKAKARHYELASVLFTDFQGFTARTATMTPEQVIEELNGCFSAFDAIVEKYNLEKIKTIGDAYMCAGGLPVPNTTNPVDIIRAGLAIQAYMQKYKEECIARGEAYFQCRLGINTGEVVAGVVGTSKFAYDIWGDTVNTASRAESTGVVNMVNITESTYQYVKDIFECQYRGEIEAKGKGRIKMYLVVGEKVHAHLS
jgi:class 3 adenylate cyclase